MIRYPIVAFICALLLGSGVLVAQGSRNGESRLDTELLRVISWVRTRPYDSIPAIDHPQFVVAEEAKVFLRPGDSVIGIARRGHAKAYPVEFLNGREVVNDSLGSGPITVTW